MKLVKKAFMVFLTFLVFVSCTTVYDFTNEKPASDMIVEDLKTKKIVFIGENHADVYPILFMTQNLEQFYEAGLRYIFLEGGFRRLHDGYSNDFLLLEPWLNAGWKYESCLFEETILNLNVLHKDDPIIVIFPEEGREDAIGTTLKDQSDNLNSRDSYAQKNIISILEKSKPEEKAIMFYGTNHGYKIMQKRFGYDWKASGVYLKERYKDDFTNYTLMHFYGQKRTDISLENDFDCKVVPNKFRSKLFHKEWSSAFDNICITKKEVYGVPYAYIPTESNIKVLIDYVKTGIEYTDKILNVEDYSATSYYCQFLSSVYYLKYHFGDLFQFDSSMSLEELKNQIVNLENIIFSQNFDINDFLIQSSTLEELEEYIKYLCSYKLIDDYLTGPVVPRKKMIPDILSSLSHAKTLNSRDIWPQYWISYFETENAMYSKQDKDFKKALSCWEELLLNDVLYASPVLKLAYRKTAFCEEQLGNKDKSLMYKEKENSIQSFWDIDYNKLTFYGN